MNIGLHVQFQYKPKKKNTHGPISFSELKFIKQKYKLYLDV